jgi:hypothetical protein
LRASLDLADRLFTQVGQPVPSVGVAEGYALCHLVDVGCWVVLRGVSGVYGQWQRGKYLVAFDVRQVHGLGNELGHGALATASWAGDEPDVVVRGLGLVGLGGMAVRERRAIGKIRGGW